MLGYDYAKENFSCPLPVRAEVMGDNSGNIMITGNEATGLGCLYAGATVGAWYPITPSTGVMDSFTMYCEKFRIDPETGDKLFCIIQAEDELAAAGMVLGANWVGARAFTPTSGPGISLMSEFIGFAYYAEIPSVFIDVQRVGPSTGMPTRTQQCDVMLCAYASHGDTRHPLLFPSNPRECFEMAVTAFDLAERLQTPGIHAVRPRYRHERLDDSRTAPGMTATATTGARCWVRRNWQKWSVSSVTWMWTVMASPTARFPAKTPRVPILCAVQATTAMAPIPKILTNTRT